MSWFFDRVPKDKIQDVLRAYNEGDLDEVLDLYKAYKVIPTGAICGSCKVKLTIITWTGFAIETIWIKNQAEYERSVKRPP